ncbi:Methionine--tRNA ligase [Rickettsiales endosymbiont of Paramecium tredecaurelia]|uniref:methionine--tRNA ligase n=1 Tax=Candidatus Sarmatiella mevalonica TaxID=2770581 RepID=UPI00192082C0|nr:methionine--tRNA ligase [Candidatus Sarmatiella mevalonica]MBL3285296.1 Methionine--tRNA ligase [Candidatus Sarmatiella mevalonica]
MQQQSYYITTPIYYVNDVPHIGHAYTNVASDVVARFMRLSGLNVRFLTGTDEHGQKIQKSAELKNIPVQKFVNAHASSFIELNSTLRISNDDFIRTTQTRHKDGVCEIWNRLERNGYIYRGHYEGWYCMRDEAFYDQSELTSDGKAPSGADVEWIKEPSYFFALSAFQERLLEFYEQHPHFVFPTSRRNEIISFVKSGLQDLSISRTNFDWGIRVPTDPEHVIYVWIDALTNYLSALNYHVGSEGDGLYREFWPAVHVIGKDIIRFHAVYWPAMLMGAGIELPKRIVSHGWWTNNGQKISKSLGNAINPIELVGEFGVDCVRYFLMRQITFGSDGDYNRESLINRYNTELVNKISNLLHRTLSFLHVNNGGQVPEIDVAQVDDESRALLNLAYALKDEAFELMSGFEINKVLERIVYLADEANAYIEHQAPWDSKKTDRNKMLQTLYVLLEVLRYIATYLQPFIPDGASKMLEQLGIDRDARSFCALERSMDKWEPQRSEPIFMRL